MKHNSSTKVIRFTIHKVNQSIIIRRKIILNNNK